MKHTRIGISLLFCFSSFSTPIFAQIPWSQYVAQLRIEALQQGIRPDIFDTAFQNIHAPHQNVLHFDRTQPEKRISYFHYRNTRASKDRIVIGRQEMKKHLNLLREVGMRYSVDPCFIVSLWGLETSYGRYMGNFPVIKSLATLAYDNRRAPLFRKELFYALHILNENHVALKNFKGEWAGASGQPQFLPSSWHKFAVDYNSDGHKDIWKSYGDIFASIANYLSMNGWKDHQPWTMPVILPNNFDETLLTTKVQKSVAEWEQMGVQFSQPETVDKQMQASVVQPEGGPALMVFNNFRVIMRWNHSIYYAGTVGYMAGEICQRPVA